MDPISPELVLVDPELARRARARLADPGESNGRVTPAREVAIARVPPTAPSPLLLLREPAARVETKTEQRPAVRPKLLLVLAGALIFLLGVLIPRVLAGGDPAPPSPQRAFGEEQPASGLARSATSAGSTLSTATGASEIQAERGRAGRVRGTVSAKRVPRPRRDQTQRPREAAPTPAGAVEGVRTPTRGRTPTRLFVWLPSRGAHYYHVRFLKGTRTVFEAWPTDARVSVPLRGTFRGRKFAFTNGRYRWLVRPAFGPRSSGRYGEPIVRSIWVVRV